MELYEQINASVYGRFKQSLMLAKAATYKRAVLKWLEHIENFIGSRAKTTGWLQGALAL